MLWFCRFVEVSKEMQSHCFAVLKWGQVPYFSFVLVLHCYERKILTAMRNTGAKFLQADINSNRSRHCGYVFYPQIVNER